MRDLKFFVGGGMLMDVPMKFNKATQRHSYFKLMLVHRWAGYNIFSHTNGCAF